MEGISALTGLIAGTVGAVALALIQLLRDTWRSRNDEVDRGFRSKDRERLNGIFDVVARTDSEGVPMTYTPRRMFRLLETLADLQRRQTDLLAEQQRMNRELMKQVAEHEKREEAQLAAIHATIREGREP